jgi:uncharacterized protein
MGAELLRFPPVKALLTLAAIAAAGPSPAQEWFTPAACLVDRAEVDPQLYPPALQAQLKAVPVPNGKGRLWKIVAPGGAVSHLWGTYHTPHPLLLDLPTEFRAILNEARVVALEFDPTPDSRDDMLESYDVNTLWLPYTQPLDDRADLSPKVMDWIALRLSDMDWAPVNLPQMTDAGLFSLLLYDPCGDYLAGLLPGQDYYIAQQAALSGVEVTGLQEPEDLAIQLTDPARAANARALVALYGAFLGPESANPNMRSTAYALYLQGRLGELTLWSSDWLQKFYGPEEARRIERAAEDYILVERNVFFVQSARPLLDRGGAVLAVGAAHLPGELGMVEMLRAKGYQVERVTLPEEVP